MREEPNMAQTIFQNIAVRIAVCVVITTAFTDARTEQMAIEKIVERLNEQSDEIKFQRFLIEKQAKQLEELTKRCTGDNSEDPGAPAIPEEHVRKGDRLNNDSRKDSSIQKRGHIVTDREPKAGIRTARQGQGMVAFTAYLGHQEELRSGEIVVFDKVITNEGGAYSKYSGVFTAPTNGVYMFIFFIGQRGVEQIGIDLVVDAHRLVGAVAEGTTSSHDLQGGNSVIVRLNKGDDVWAKQRFGTHLEGNTYERTTFSGFLMY